MGCGAEAQAYMVETLNAVLKGRSFTGLSRRCAMLLALALLSGCGKLAQMPVQSFVAEPFPQKLSEWHLFVGQGDGLRLNQRVLPYDLNTPLFSDYAAKHRFVWLP